MTSLLQISDPHFGTERPEVVAALRTLTAAVVPSVVIVSGDVTQRARRSQYRRAAAFLDSLGPMRRLVVPGNHDIPLFDVFTRAIDPYREYRRAFGRDLEPEFDSNELLVSCVNTTRASRHKDGEVSDAQIERVAARLRGARPEQLRVVVVHQPIGVMREQDEVDRLHGAERAARSWSAAGVDLILGGHIHLPYVLALHEQMPGLPRRVWAVQAGTAVSNRIRPEADNSVNLVTYTRAGTKREAEIARWDWQAQAGRFECLCTHTLHLSETHAS